eukprot:3094276-Pleurochrysis_carterae.AAC.2
MDNTTKDPTAVSSQQPSWDCSQLTIRAWIDDVLTWIPTRDSAFAPLIEHGYVITSHGRVVVSSADQAVAVFHRVYTPYPLHNPRRSIPRSIFHFRRSLRRFVHERAPQSPPPRPPTARNQLT